MHQRELECNKKENSSQLFKMKKGSITFIFTSNSRRHLSLFSNRFSQRNFAKKTVWNFKTRIWKIAQELKTKSHPNLNNLNSNQDFAFNSRFEIDKIDFKYQFKC